MIFTISCQWFRMDYPGITDIRLYNRCEYAIMPLSNWSIIDTLLSQTRAERAVYPNDNSAIAWVQDWESKVVSI